MVLVFGAVSGPDVQSQNFGIEYGNVRDRMDNPKLCRKSIFESLDWRVTTGPGWAGRQRTRPVRHAWPSARPSTQHAQPHCSKQRARVRLGSLGARLRLGCDKVVARKVLCHDKGIVFQEKKIKIIIIILEH